MAQDTRKPDYPEYELAAFLEGAPPGLTAIIKDACKYTGTRSLVIEFPQLQLHCPSPKCGGLRQFRPEDGTRYLREAEQYLFVPYSCRNCSEIERTYALFVLVLEKDGGDALVHKLGEFPPFGPPIPSRAMSLVGPDREIFLQGRRAENHGLGIGAFAYYRRVVEDIKNRILNQIIDVIRKSGGSESDIAQLQEAIKQPQFTTSMEMAKDAVPKTLYVKGQNPLLLLHGTLSRGIHELSEQECLELAQSVRIVLYELADAIGRLLREEKELDDAVNRLIRSRERREKRD